MVIISRMNFNRWGELRGGMGHSESGIPSCRKPNECDVAANQLKSVLGFSCSYVDLDC
jgi:hypothetical protein